MPLHFPDSLTNDAGDAGAGTYKVCTVRVAPVAASP